jgi:hypothetical protein
MNRRALTTIALALLAVLFATALPRIGFAQSDPLLGMWQLNLAKSKYSPGPSPKSGTIYVRGEGQNRKATAVGIDAAGNPTAILLPEYIPDGKPHPVTGAPAYDASVWTRVDAYTLNVSRTKAGKIVQTVSNVVTPDGKTLTLTTTGTDENGRQFNNIAVYDKQ